MTPFQAFDALCIAPFRLLPNPEAGFALGCLLLALGSAALGRACRSLAERAQRARRAQVEDEARRSTSLSIQALHLQDKDAYLAQNRLASEHYGNTMALAAGRGAALLWPGMLALAWLSWRFDGVPLPLLWDGAPAAAWFLPPYAASLWALARVKKSASGGRGA